MADEGKGKLCLQVYIGKHDLELLDSIIILSRETGLSHSQVALMALRQGYAAVESLLSPIRTPVVKSKSIRKSQHSLTKTTRTKQRRPVTAHKG